MDVETIAKAIAELDEDEARDVHRTLLRYEARWTLVPVVDDNTVVYRFTNHWKCDGRGNSLPFFDTAESAVIQVLDEHRTEFEARLEPVSFCGDIDIEALEVIANTLRTSDGRQLNFARRETIHIPWSERWRAEAISQIGLGRTIVIPSEPMVIGWDDDPLSEGFSERWRAEAVRQLSQGCICGKCATRGKREPR